MLIIIFIKTIIITPKLISPPIPTSSNLRELLQKLVITIPNDLIKNETKGYISDLTIYDITLESLITSRKKELSEKKIGMEFRIRNAELKIKGNYSIFSEKSKNFLAAISNLNIILPLFLVKNEQGLVEEVDTSGFDIDLDKVQIELDLEISDVLRNLILGILKLVLKIIKTNVIEKYIVNILNTKLEDIFYQLNDIILNGAEPDELYITIKEKDIADIRNSPIIGSIGYLLTNFTGANGPLSLNDLVNIFTYDTGIIRLNDIYNKKIEFEFNLTDKNNITLGDIQFELNDLNISGLNTWKKFDALEPYTPIQLNTFTLLQNFTLNTTFSINIKLYNTLHIVQNETILYENVFLRTNLQNNSLNAFLQLPVNNTAAKQYTNKECLDMNCVIDLADNNGTGITLLSMKETFTYVLLELKEGSDLEEDLSDSFNKITDLFISNFNDQINTLINVVLNTTLINLVNNKINDFLYSTICPGIEDPAYIEIDALYTSSAAGIAIGLFTLLIFFPYILGRALNNKKTDNKKEIKAQLIENENIEENNRLSIISTDLKDIKNAPTEAKYCIENISIKWLKELGRTDPSGASLFLDPRLPLFFRIFIPLAILLTIALFISANSGIGASVFVVFQLGKRVQVPSLFNFGLINSVHDMCVAGSWVLSVLVAVFSGIWPYLKLLLMLISFLLPTSILSHKSREKILIILDATGKFSILDSYVMIMMLVAFHFHIDIPLSEKSLAKSSSIIDVFVYAAYGFFALILATLISLCLSHIITQLHRRLDEHPDQNKGEKAESHKSIMSFAKSKCFGDRPFRIFISVMLFTTLTLVILGSITQCFSFYFHGLAGYALELFDIAPHREYSIISLGLRVPAAYENPDDPVIRFTQVVYFITVLVIPLSFIVTLIILWFIPMPRKAQKIILTLAEILNAWSCIDVFVIAIVASLTEIEQFTKFIVGDKCKDIDPIIQKYFSKTLNEHDTCFEVKSYLEEGCWLFFAAAISYFISSFVILKVCRNALNERLPDHVKEYLKMKKKNSDRISNISNINDFSISRDTVVKLANGEENETNNNMNEDKNDSDEIKE